MCTTCSYQAHPSKGNCAFEPPPLNAVTSLAVILVSFALRSISNRNIASDYGGMHLTQQVSEAGFSGLWPSGPRGGALGPQATTFAPPCLMSHKIVAQSRGFESMVVVYAGVSVRVCVSALPCVVGGHCRLSWAWRVAVLPAV